MLTTQAFFEYKVTNIEYKNCVVEKTIRLSDMDFDSFSRNLVRSHDFLRENAELTGYTEDGKSRCILVMAENRQHGILVNPERGDYARYSAILPNVASFLTMNRYPEFAALSEKLDDMVDHIIETATAERGKDLESTGYEVDIEDIEHKFDIDFARNHLLLEVLTNRLCEHDGIETVEPDKNNIILYWEGASALSAELVADHNPQPPSPLEDVLQAAKIEHPTLKEVFELAKVLIDPGDLMIDRARIILESGLASVSSVSELIEFMDEDNLYRFDIIDASDATELGEYWKREMTVDFPDDVTPEEHGQTSIAKEKGVFTKWGYVYERFGGDDAQTLSAPTTELGGKNSDARDSGGYTSVLKTIEKAKTEPKPPRKEKDPDRKQKNGEEL
jgi:hypothetical protein